MVIYRTGIIVLFLLFSVRVVFPGNDSIKKVSYLEMALYTGKVVTNGSFYPDMSLQKGISIDLGFFKTLNSYSWNSYFNYPFYGLQLGYLDYGNRQILGNSLFLSPYVVLRTSRISKNSIDFKIGLGGAWFFHPYNPRHNPDNKAVGSHLNFIFQASVWYSLFTIKNYKVKIGSGFAHSSNGHVQLPNFGMNSAIFSLAVQGFTPQSKTDDIYVEKRPKKELKKAYFLDLNHGVGLHEFGNTSGPVGGEKKLVHSAHIGAGVLYRRYLKISAGVTYQYYEHYYAYMDARGAYDDVNKFSESSNLYFSLSSEFIFGHIGFCAAGGLNIYKPFYDDYERIFRGNPSLDFWLRKLFNTRLAIQYYLYEPYNHNWNVYIGVGIHANFGEADFAGVNIGMLKML